MGRIKRNFLLPDKVDALLEHAARRTTIGKAMGTALWYFYCVLRADERDLAFDAYDAWLAGENIDPAEFEKGLPPGSRGEIERILRRGRELYAEEARKRGVESQSAKDRKGRKGA